MVYYPLAKIQPNLFTSGNEFAIAATGVDYKGYYFSTYDGKFFTEKIPSMNSVELIKYAPTKSLTSLGSLKYALKDTAEDIETNHFIPKPTSKDYEAGSITRYFVKRVNGDESTLKEIDRETYVNLQGNPLYILDECPWHISGNTEDTLLPGGITLPGVSSMNRAATQKVNIKIPGVSTYLRDPLQFFK